MDINWVSILRFIGAGLSICLPSIGCGYGEGRIAGRAAEAIARQPKASSDIVRSMLITQAVNETAGIFGLLVAIILLFVVPSSGGIAQAITFLAAGLCIGIGGIGVGIGSGLAGSAACEAVGRHPNGANKIISTTLIGQAVVETDFIFSLVIALLLIFIVPSTIEFYKIGAVLGAGFSMGFGAIGACIGIGIIAQKAIIGLSKNMRNGFIITRTMFLGQAITETMAVLSLIVSLLLLIMSGLM
jgi:ATP synthase F0 subunit c